MKKMLSCVITITALLTSLFTANVYAGADGTIYISPENPEVRRGESVVVDLVSDTDVLAQPFSAIEWAFDKGSFIVEVEDPGEFTITIDDYYGRIIMGLIENSVQLRAGVPFASLRFTALDNARLITRNSNNVKCDIVDENLEFYDITADDILISIVSDAPPTATPRPVDDTPVTEPPAPTTPPSNGNNSGNNNGNTTGTVPTQTPRPVQTLEPTGAPTQTPTAAPTQAPTAAPTVQPAAFGDVPESHWAYEYIADLSAMGIASGNPDGNFYPENNITRAEFTKMAVELFDIDMSAESAAFTDVPATEWYTPYINAGVAAGIVNGTTSDTFEPDANVTREQMAAIIGRRVNLAAADTELSYTDAGDIEDYALPYVQALTENGLLSGQESGAFMPKDPATRAEASALLSRVADQL